MILKKGLMKAVNRRKRLSEGFPKIKGLIIVKIALGEWREQEMKKHLPLCFLFLSPQPLSVAKEAYATDSAYE